MQFRFFLKDSNARPNMTDNLVQNTKDTERPSFAERMQGAIIGANDCSRPFVLQDPRQSTIKPFGTPSPEGGANVFRELETASSDIEYLGGGHHPDATGVQLGPVASGKLTLDQPAHGTRMLNAGTNYPVGPIVKSGHELL
jgi:hypothetical protein